MNAGTEKVSGTNRVCSSQVFLSGLGRAYRTGKRLPRSDYKDGLMQDCHVLGPSRPESNRAYQGNSGLGSNCVDCLQIRFVGQKPVGCCRRVLDWVIRGTVRRAGYKCFPNVKQCLTISGPMIPIRRESVRPTRFLKSGTKNPRGLVNPQGGYISAGTVRPRPIPFLVSRTAQQERIVGNREKGRCLETNRNAPPLGSVLRQVVDQERNVPRTHDATRGGRVYSRPPEVGWVAASGPDVTSINGAHKISPTTKLTCHGGG